jgi:hypothetical protein
MPSARSAKLVGVLVRCGKELIQFSRATSSMSVNHELSTLKSIKGTGEASPVRGGDWAGFKFGADRAAV